MSKSVKRTIIVVACIVLAVLMIFGIMNLVKVIRKKPVAVYSVEEVGMIGDMGATSEAYGEVRTDKMQKIYLSSTQTLTEIMVKEGDSVKAGDPVLSYDTSLNKLDVKKSEIAVEKQKIKLDETKAFLESLNNVLIRENLDAQLAALETELAREEERIENISPEYPKLPLGSYTEDDPYYVELTDEIDLSDYTNGLSAGDEKWVVFVTSDGSDFIDYKGVRFSCDDEGHVKFAFFDAAPLEGEYPDFEDHREEIQQKIDNLYNLMNNSYSTAELAELKVEKTKEIGDLEISIKVAELDHQKKVKEADEGVVYSTVDGVVKSVNTEDDGEGGPVVEISGGGGYYIDCGIAEFDLESVSVGDTVDVNSWSNGTYCSGEIVDIDTSATYSSDMYYDGNTNVSSYKMTVFVTEDDDLIEGDYVSVSYQKNAGVDTLSLPNMFIRYENGKPYVMAESDNGTLEKIFIETGMDYWGEYTEIRDGVALGDRVAFPYGSDVVEGAKTVEGQIEDLYGGYKYY